MVFDSTPGMLHRSTWAVTITALLLSSMLRAADSPALQHLRESLPVPGEGLIDQNLAWNGQTFTQVLKSRAVRRSQHRRKKQSSDGDGPCRSVKHSRRGIKYHPATPIGVCLF